MKKIVIITLSLFLLASCANNNSTFTEKENEMSWNNNQENISIEKKPEVEKEETTETNQQVVEEVVELKKFATNREALFNMSESELKKLACPSLKDEDLELICFQLKKSSIVTVQWEEQGEEIKISKSELNKWIEKWNANICKKAYSNDEDIFDCKIWVVLSSDATCDVFSLGNKDKCEKIIDWVQFVKEYEEKKNYYDKYVQYLEE